MSIKAFFVTLVVSASALAEEPAATVKAAAGIENREPTGEASSFKKGERVYVWSQIDHSEGQTVEHVWKRDGKEVRRAQFEVGSSRWRVNSRLSSAPSGSYVVDLVAGDRVLGTVNFTVE